jgi:hypothetical protein
VLATLYGTDKGPAEDPASGLWVGHNYTPHYERHFEPLRALPVTLLEIGVREGASLRMWAEWFTNAQIIGVDFDPTCTLNEGRVSTIICPIQDLQFTSPLDIVVDDGSHVAEDISAGLSKLWPLVVLGGWYVVEDIGNLDWAGSLSVEEMDAIEATIHPSEVYAYPSESHNCPSWIRFYRK